MSDLPPIADIHQREWHVRCAEADIQRAETRLWVAGSRDDISASLCIRGDGRCVDQPETSLGTGGIESGRQCKHGDLVVTGSSIASVEFGDHHQLHAVGAASDR